MKAVLYKEKAKICIAEMDIPRPEPAYVLIKVYVCGICGSDLYSYRGHSLRRNFIKWRQLKHADGHEFSGIVVKKGKFTNNVKLGDRVVGECFWHCGKCKMCKARFYNLCFKRQDTAWKSHSGFAEYILLPSRSLYKFPASVSFSEAAMAEPLAAAYRAIQKAKLENNGSLLILGAGTMGLLCAAVAKTEGIKYVAIVSKYRHQEKIAYKLGVNKVFSLSKDMISNLSEAMPEGFDAIIDTVGTVENFSLALKVVRKAGCIILIGGYLNKGRVDLKSIVGSEIKIMGSSCYSWSGNKRDFKEAIKLISTKKIDVSKLITHTFPLKMAAQAFKVAEDKRKGSIKVQLFME